MGIRIRLHAEGTLNRALILLHTMYVRRRQVATGGVSLLALWLALHVIFGANGMMVYQQKRQEYTNLQGDIKVLSEENERYAQEINALKSDPSAIEKEAREQLHYARPGEIIYVVPEPRREPPPTNAAKK